MCQRKILEAFIALEKKSPEIWRLANINKADSKDALCLFLLVAKNIKKEIIIK